MEKNKNTKKKKMHFLIFCVQGHELIYEYLWFWAPLLKGYFLVQLLV